jgi:serine/threonine protein kinase
MKDFSVDERIRSFVRETADFEIHSYSDQGGFGHLYFGRRKITNDDVALKFYFLDPNETEHFEPRTLQELKNEFIIPILEAKQIFKDIAYHVTPYMAGGDLSKYLDTTSVKTHEAADIVQKILRAIGYLHSDPQNMVHMDLKVHNILMNENGDIPFLADFGAVKRIPKNSNFVTKGQYTLPYMPPECVNGDKYFRQSDIYQLGIVLFQLLYGYFPIDNATRWLKEKDRRQFIKLTATEQMPYVEKYIKDLIARGKLLNLNSLPPYVGRDLKSILRKALHIDLSQRFQTCHEFSRALFLYQHNSHDWWTDKDDDTMHAFCRKKEKYYRIVFRGSKMIAEASSNAKQWRKIFEATNTVHAVERINNLLPR